MPARERYTKLSFSLPSHVAGWLRETGNASQYISRVLEDRWRAWTSALDQLAGAGWSPEAIALACAALSQAGLVTVSGERLTARVHAALAHLDVELPLLAHLTEADAYALVISAREYQTYNDAFDRALGRVGDAEPVTKESA